VANHASAEKRNRQRINRTARNKARKSAVRSFVKKVRAALESKDVKGATEALATATSALDKAAARGALHAKSASRTVARLSAQLHQLASAK
jgi:small subunit ribosomal protein S20